MRIILDTNFLVYCAKQKINYLEVDREFVVLSSVIKELEKIEEKARRKKDKEAASLALQILKKNVKKNKIKILIRGGEADVAIIEFAKKGDIVATMDRELKRKLRGRARILSIRKGKKLEIL